MLTSIIAAQNWELKISLEKETYVEEANIYLLISLRNISGAAFESNTRVCEVLLKNVEEDNQSKLYEKIAIPGPEMILKTYPDERILRESELVVSFGHQGSKYFLHKLKSGTYKIRARYEDILTKNKIDTLRHKFYYSNELTFNIVKPSKKDLILKNKFVNVFEQSKKLGYKGIKESTKKFIELINEYPNNPYVSLVVFYLWVGPSYLFKNEIIKLIKKYPNKYWVRVLYASLKYEQRKNIKIGNKLKGTLLDRFITSGNLERRAVKEYERMYK